MTDADLATLLEPHSPQVRDVLGALRALAREVMPDATEQVDLPDRVLAFGFGSRMADFAVGMIPHTAHVNVQLADGASLPRPLFDGGRDRPRARLRMVRRRPADWNRKARYA